MKWDCDARRERKIKRLEAKAAKMLKWHRHFAIWPVKIDYGDCRWLEMVYRKYPSIHKFYDHRYYQDFSRYKPQYMSKEIYNHIVEDQKRLNNNVSQLENEVNGKCSKLA